MQRQFEGLPDRLFGCRTQFDARTALAAPGPLDRLKNRWLRACEYRLLIRCKLNHPPLLVRAQRGEDLAGDAEIGMVHVRGFDRIREAQGQLAEFIGGHRNDSIRLLAVVLNSNGRQGKGLERLSLETVANSTQPL